MTQQNQSHEGRWPVHAAWPSRLCWKGVSRYSPAIFLFSPLEWLAIASEEHGLRATTFWKQPAAAVKEIKMYTKQKASEGCGSRSRAHVLTRCGSARSPSAWLGNSTLGNLQFSPQYLILDINTWGALLYQLPGISDKNQYALFQWNTNQQLPEPQDGKVSG